MVCLRQVWVMSLTVAAAFGAGSACAAATNGDEYDSGFWTPPKDAEEAPEAKPEKAVRAVRAQPVKSADPKVRAKKGANDVAYHLKNLNDKDPDVRKTSCEMLGWLGAIDAVLPLIDMLRPERREPLDVQLTANGALVKITGKNFGAKGHAEWVSWWSKNKESFIKKAESGVDEKAKIRGKYANEMGLNLNRAGEFRGAEQQFIDAVSADPTVVDYRVNLGVAVRNQGRCVEAMQYFEEVIGLDPDLPQPYMNIAICYSMLGRSIEAHSWYKKATERDKDGKLWELSWMIGQEFKKRGEWSMAYEYLDQARVKMEKLGIHNRSVYNDLAITHYGLDQYHSAWKELMNIRALGFEPNPDFLAKVRKALKDQGVDSEKENEAALAVQRSEALKDIPDVQKEQILKP